jgi:hypothetical protein
MMIDAEKRFRTFLSLDLERRGLMFSHALVRSQRGSREAMDLLEFIKWVCAEDRQQLKDIPCESSPDRGMLKALGYRVGEAGVDTAERRMILNYLLTEDALPAIHGLGYMRKRVVHPTRYVRRSCGAFFAIWPMRNSLI